MTIVDMLAFQEYYKEPDKLGEKGLNDLLERGKKWSFADDLLAGGCAIFPHAYLSQCGDQVAAVVTSCLDAGVDQVLVLGVLHRLSHELINAVEKEKKGGSILGEKCRGIFGPGKRGSYWQKEFSLFNFKTLWDAEVRRRGIKSPKLIFRYPFLVNCDPASHPGIEELKEIAKDSIVVATGDLCHHGTAFSADDRFKINDTASLLYAKQTILDNFDLLQSGDYRAFYAHCLRHKNDFFYVGMILRHLLGPYKGKILDLRLIDIDKLYPESKGSNWVASSLCLFRHKRM